MRSKFDFLKTGSFTGIDTTDDTVPFSAEQVIDHRYRILEYLGKGALGRVYKAEFIPMKKIFAVKVFKNGEQTPLALDIYRRLSQLKHRNIVRVERPDWIANGKLGVLPMEYLFGKTMADILENSIQTIDWTVKKHWITSLLSVVVYLQKQPEPVIHAKITPANIIVDLENEPVLLDFSLNTVLDIDAQKTEYLQYLSPESRDGKLNLSTDCFSVGLIAYGILSNGKFPFQDGLVDERQQLIPLEYFRGDLPVTIAQWADKACALKLADRFQNMNEMETAFNLACNEAGL